MEADIIWRPSAKQIEDAQLTRYVRWLGQTRGLTFADYDALWQWSIDNLEEFWRSIWDYFSIQSEAPPTRVLAERAMPGARWFPGTRINYVHEVFRHKTQARPAIVAENEAGAVVTMSWDTLEQQVASLAQWLGEQGVVAGDRVVAYMPNIAPTIVAFLATASIGAVWSVCSPDMGAASVLDRFRQIEPKVLLTVDGYVYAGKSYDRLAVVDELVAALPTVKAVVLLCNLDPAADCARWVHGFRWPDLIARVVPLTAPWLAFDHPLWIVYSSGTTGMPKAIVHSHGGVLLEGLKGAIVHNDLGPEDRFHWYSSTGWIMWNSQVGGLIAGATVVLYDGSPSYPDASTLWRFVARHRVTVFGAGAAFYAACLKAEVDPAACGALDALRGLGSTGSPLSPEAFTWIYDHMRSDVWLNVISGGTDFAGAFLVGNMTLPLRRGEMQSRSLGAAVYAFDENGVAHIDQVGELVCTEPIPSMPLYFWNDPGDQRYRDSYFDMFPGVWRHGDWLRITPHGGAIIYGRSDATINRHGIRMGTSELYRAVEALPEILDSLVVDLEYLGRESYMPLFVVLRPGHALDEQLEQRIRVSIRQALSARHVPNTVFQVSEIPRTLSGKKLELPVKKLLLGQSVAQVVNPGAMANPDSLAWFVAFAAQLSR